METHRVEAHGGGPFPPILPGFSVLHDAAVCVCSLGSSPALATVPLGHRGGYTTPDLSRSGHRGGYTAPELSRAVAVSVGHGSFQGLHKVKTTVMVILRRESPFSPRFSQGVGQGSPEAGDTMTLVTAAHWVDARMSLYF